ncbi:camphor resistance protein CrcB [Stackebrandtia albiflava]|uniref:Fluoride-specific ion channel FluC n=1 Tax=Stackebrandtia albiflava TaxID=406432 RepID=A0A562V216_9ACTN|nr:CrcB family protein [Stackebrandtia albiflava]TWJ11901.1 camphor resistance protein CrcB [Stackebrandtia albiflava]
MPVDTAPARPGGGTPRHATAVPLVALGAVAGALARYGIELAWPVPVGAIPWPTFGVNVAGCLLIGVLTGLAATRPVPGWLRPLLGVGLLGGFTTFSGYATQAVALADAAPWRAGLYLAVTLFTGLAAAWLGDGLARRAGRSRR